LLDTDGVLVHEEHALPGVAEFLQRLVELGRPLVLTNNSIWTPRDLAAGLSRGGLDAPPDSISGRRRSRRRASPRTNARAAPRLWSARRDSRLRCTMWATHSPIANPTTWCSARLALTGFEGITGAIRLVDNGARFIATNPDNVGAEPQRVAAATGLGGRANPACRGVKPYYVGKPNPLMMRSALNAIDAHSETTAMIGDRMDTDIVAGLEAGLETILVLTGVTTLSATERYPYRASRIVESVADLLELAG
jgi:NagD protein